MRCLISQMLDQPSESARQYVRDYLGPRADQICVSCLREGSLPLDERLTVLEAERDEALKQISAIRDAARQEGMVALSQIMDILGEP